MVKVLDRESINRMTRNSGRGGSTYVGGGGGGSYTLPVAADGTLGGVQVGYTTDATARKYAVQLDGEKAYVNVPWTDHYAWSDITDKPTTATRWPSWDEVTSKPNSFTPSAHTHAWGDITSGVPATATRWPSWSEVTSKPTSKTAWGQTYLNSSSEFQNVSGDLSAGSSGGTISQFHSIELNSAGSLGGYGGFIDFHFNGSSSDYTSRIIEDASGEINIQATTKVSNLYSRGYVTALSDARKKRVLGDIVLSAEQIAKMPAVRFEWKNNENPGIFIGTLAQNWREILPEAVHTLGDGTLSFDYQSAALVSVINLARRVLKLERRVSKLEKEITKLKEQKNVTE